MRLKKTAVTAAATAAALCLAGGAAFAAVAPAPITTTTGTAGYDGGTIAAPYLNNVQAVITPTDYGTLVKGGAHGVGMCAANGRTALIGLVANGDATYQVDYAQGSNPGHCPVDQLLPGPVSLNPALSHVPFGHSVWVSVSYGQHRVIRVIRGHRTIIIIGRAGALTFAAQDVTGTPGPVYQAVVRTPVTRFIHPDAGVIEDLTTLTPCLDAASNPVPGVLPGPAAYTSAACHPVDRVEYATYQSGATVTALTAGPAAAEGISPAASPALVAPDNSASLVNTGPHGTSTAASATGSHFTVSTGNVKSVP